MTLGPHLEGQGPRRAEFRRQGTAEASVNSVCSDSTALASKVSYFILNEFNIFKIFNFLIASIF